MKHYDMSIVSLAAGALISFAIGYAVKTFKKASPRYANDFSTRAIQKYAEVAGPKKVQTYSV